MQGVECPAPLPLREAPGLAAEESLFRPFRVASCLAHPNPPRLGKRREHCASHNLRPNLYLNSLVLSSARSLMSNRKNTVRNGVSPSPCGTVPVKQLNKGQM